MDPTSNSLREQAKNCRTLAVSVTTPGTRDAMLEMAADYDRRAEKLENEADGRRAPAL
jgi:hypothetical protein